MSCAARGAVLGTSYAGAAGGGRDPGKATPVLELSLPTYDV